MAEYNQDRFVVEVIAKEIESPERIAKAKVYVRFHLQFFTRTPKTKIVILLGLDI